MPAGPVVGHLSAIDYTGVVARGGGRFRGTNETIARVGGNIPGSHNRPYTQNLNADNTFKSPDALRAEWLAALGGRTPAQIVHSCGSGVQGWHNLLAMAVAGPVSFSTLTLATDGLLVVLGGGITRHTQTT